MSTPLTPDDQRRAAHVAEVLADAPPLTPEQRTRLAELLKPVRIQPAAAAK